MSRILWFLMLLLLAGTAVGASWAFNNGTLSFGKQEPKVKPAADSGPPPMVVALGQVDGETQVAKPLPLVQGRIVELPRKEPGVKKGAALLKLDDGMYKAMADVAKAALDAAQQRHEQAKDCAEQYRLKEKQQQAAINAAQAEKKSVKLERDTN